MTRFTRELRQEILDEFLALHNTYDARVFWEWAREQGPEHKVYDWFTWDDAKAADAHRNWEARVFVNGLTVKFSVETVEFGKVRVREQTMPMMISPLSTRQHGGGYSRTDPTDPETMAALCDEAAKSLRAWIRRYRGALAWAGGSTTALAKVTKTLETTVQKADAA